MVLSIIKLLLLIGDGGRRCAGIQADLKTAQKQIVQLRSAAAAALVGGLAAGAETLPGGARAVAASLDALDAKSLQVTAATAAAPRVRCTCG